MKSRRVYRHVFGKTKITENVYTRNKDSHLSSPGVRCHPHFGRIVRTIRICHLDPTLTATNLKF